MKRLRARWLDDATISSDICLVVWCLVLLLTALTVLVLLLLNGICTYSNL